MFIEQWDSAVHPVLLRELQLEIDDIARNKAWNKTFERAGSYMFESNDRGNLPALQKLYNIVSDPLFLRDLESKLNITGIICDPHMVGAGYSQIKDHGDLKPHIDFNWNDRIKMYRVASLIIYLSTPEEGGEIEFEGINKIAVESNRAVLFEHSETVRHFVHPVKGIRNAIRFFYYASKLDAPAGYHRSLYGLRDGKPVDVN
jgi:hypothetical protein